MADLRLFAEAAKAMAYCNGKELDGRALKVNEAKPREERPMRQKPPFHPCPSGRNIQTERPMNKVLLRGPLDSRPQ